MKVYSLQQSSEWDTIVQSFSQYDVYYLSGYVRAFQLHGDGEPLLFYYEENGLRGINVVMKRDIADDPHFAGRLQKGEYFDFATPYGYGGWLLEGEENSTPLFQSYQDWCCTHGIVSEFVRFHPLLQNQKNAASFYEVPLLGCTIALDLASPEVIWANLTRQNRNKIRKAEKNGVKIFRGHNRELYTQFRNIYNATMDKDSAKPYYYFKPDFYESILTDLSNNAQIFYAKLDEEIIAASIMLYANGNMHYHLSGSRREFQNLAPTNLLLYEAAVWGSENGYQFLHLGGGVGASEDSLYQFKRSFYRGEPKQYYVGKAILSPERYEFLCTQRENLQETCFFPQYRG